MLKRNKKIIAILTATMITSLVNTGVAFADTKEGTGTVSNVEENYDSSNGGSLVNNSESTEEANKDVQTESKQEDNEGNIEQKDQVSSTGNAADRTETSDKVEESSIQQDILSDAELADNNGTSKESEKDINTSITIKSDKESNSTIVEVAANINGDETPNLQANTAAPIQNLLVTTQEVEANTSITLDIGKDNIIITNGTGGSIKVTGKGLSEVENIDGKEISSSAQIIITGGSKDSPSGNFVKISDTCMPNIIIQDAFINNYEGIIGGNITVKSGTINGSIQGGYSKSTQAGNVVIEGGTIKGAVFGGNTYNGTAGNVVIKGGTVVFAVGGHSVETAGGTVTLESGEVKEDIYGGNSENGSGGTVTIKGGTVNGVNGGYTENGTGGTVIIKGGTMNYAVGGHSVEAAGGDVTLEGGEVKWEIWGGNSENGTGGTVTINGGTVNGVVGGFSPEGTGGDVVINGGTVGHAAGGESFELAGGTVTINGGTVDDVMGGFSPAGTGGDVVINGGTINGNASGGESIAGTGGTVTLIDGEVGNITGGATIFGKEAGAVNIKGGKVNGFVLGGIILNRPEIYYYFENKPTILKGGITVQGSVNIEGGTVDGTVLSGVELDEKTGVLKMNYESGELAIENWKSIGNAVTVNGGSIRQIIINNPQNGDKLDVYKNTVKLPIDKDEEITCSVDNSSSTWKATTLDNGFLYIYLPESKENEVHRIRVTDSKGKVYLYDVSTKTDGSSIAVPVIEKESSSEDKDIIARLSDAKREVEGTLEKLIIDIKDKNIIDKEVFNYLRANSNRQLVLKGDNYSWVISGQDVIDGNINENFDAHATINYEQNGAIRVKVNKALGKITLKGIDGNIQSLKLYGVDENNVQKLLNPDLKVSNKEVSFDLTSHKEYILSVN